MIFETTDDAPLIADVFELLIDTGTAVMVFVDPTHRDLVVPEGIEVRMLLYGVNLPIPTTDIHVDDSGIYGTLSFNRVPKHTAVPWEAVIGLKDEQEEIIVQRPEFLAAAARNVERIQREEEEGGGHSVLLPKKPHPFKVIDGGKNDPDGGAA